MNSLGREWRSCARSLHEYWRVIGGIRRAARGRDSWHATARLDAVQFALDVDVGAREGEPGRDRMTDVEAEVLYPALGAARGVLASITTRTPQHGWDPALADALAILRQATGRLRAWSPRCGGAARLGANLPSR